MSDKMREALTQLIRAYVNVLEVGRDRIIQQGGECDPLEVMERSDPALRVARAALAEQPAQGEAVAQIVNGELMWFIPHHSYALDAKFRSGRWMLYTAPPAPSVPSASELDALMDAVRSHGSRCTNVEILAKFSAMRAAAPEMPS